MKRSEINNAIREMEELLDKYRFALPDFCLWTPEDWNSKGPEYSEIRDNMLGWDVTDYGEGRFDKKGLTLITLRNGNPRDPKYTKTYAEKIMMSREEQISPMHFHWSKMEDIINRGGGKLVFTLYNAAPDGSLADTDVTVCQDGCTYTVPAGSEVVLSPGQSLTLYPYCYHAFTAKKGTGSVLIGEVSMCNDDLNDNRFLEELGRFPSIEEDEPPYRLLCNEYPEVPHA
jgi:D-lyxose ketol-isomerase